MTEVMQSEQIEKKQFFSWSNPDDVNSLDLNNILNSACHFIALGTTHHDIGKAKMAEFLQTNTIHSLTVEELVKGTILRVSFFIGANKYDVNFRFKLFRCKEALERLLGQVIAETLLIHKNYAEQVRNDIENKIMNSYSKQDVYDFQEQNKEIIEEVCAMITHKSNHNLLFPRPFRDDAYDTTGFKDITEKAISDCHNKVENLACDLVNALQSNSDNRFYFDVNSIIEVLTQKEVNENGKEVFKYSSFDIGGLIGFIDKDNEKKFEIGSIIETIIAFYNKCYEDYVDRYGFDKFEILGFLQNSLLDFEAKAINRITEMIWDFEKYNSIDYCYSLPLTNDFI